MTIRVGGAAPPAASRCCARASLRAPSRGDPPHEARVPREAAGLRWGHSSGGTPRRDGVRTARYSNVSHAQ